MGQECRDSLLEAEVFEHGPFKGFPRQIRITNATHRALGDAGVGGTKAFECGFPADLPQLFFAAPETIAKQIAGPGHPGAFEGVNDHAPLIAKDCVAEGEGFAASSLSDLGSLTGLFSIRGR